jgi:hypothetical protein
MFLLILALYEGLDQSEYDTLSKIAPTVAQSAQYDAFGAPWQDMTLTAGRALGRQQQAQELVIAVEQELAAEVVRSGRVGYFDYTTPPFPGAAITFNTVLSIPYALDQVVPELGWMRSRDGLEPRRADTVGLQRPADGRRPAVAPPSCSTPPSRVSFACWGRAVVAPGTAGAATGRYPILGSALR